MGGERPSGAPEIERNARRAHRSTTRDEGSLAQHPRLFTLGQSALGGPDVLAGPDLAAALQQILFPTANPLTENQRYDVEHLRLHVRTGGDVFVTLNLNDFITRGRQETLRSFGVWVLSPGDLVRLLAELYGWT